MTGKERKGRVLGGRRATASEGKRERCPKCGAAPGHSCFRWSPAMGYVQLKNPHPERKS